MKKFVFLSLFLILTILISPFQIFPVQAQAVSHIPGVFAILRGDANPKQGGDPRVIYQLFGDDGQIYPLEIDESVLVQNGGIQTLDRQRVRAEIVRAPLALTAGGLPVYPILSLTLDNSSPAALDSSVHALMSGSQPWVSILCKFNDIPDEPKSLDYFQGMYSHEYPGLNHYWREVSYNTIDINGSSASGWHTLPQPRSYYVSVENYTMLERLVNDCTHAADPYVDFNQFTGVNMMFNGDLDGYAWGGYWYLNLDGADRFLNMTWEPVWGYEDITVMSHEMGHGFGLPHSSGPYGNTYDNVWDVMSDTWSNCSSSTDATYGCLGQHTIAYHKDILGWIPADRKYTVPYAGSGAPTPVILPESKPLVMVRVPVFGDSDHFYTVEVRRKVGYDVKLPGNTVVIHDVVPSRADERPAHVVDADLDGYTDDEGAMWDVGETFQDNANQINVSVLSSSGENFHISITNGVQTATLWLMPLGKPHPIADVSMFHWALESILKLKSSNITGGCGADPLAFTYCPENEVTRAQMAVFLEKGVHYPSTYTAPNVTPTFSDTVGHWAEDWIEALKSGGITSGCGAGLYCPDDPVTRAQMAVFLLKAKYGSSYTPPAVGTSTNFGDVPTDHWASAWIKQLAAESITIGCGGGNYCPENPVTRAQMAVFLVKTFNLP